MVSWCASDPRLKPVGYLPLNNPERAVATLEEALEAGVAAVWVPSDAPGDFSPTHVDLDPVWSSLASARVPFVLHVGGGSFCPPSTTTGCRDPRTGSAAERTCGRRTSRSAPLARALSGMHGARRGIRAPSRAARRRRRARRDVGAGNAAQRRSCPSFVLEVRVGPALALAQTVGVPASPGSLHPVPLRGHGLVAGAVRTGPPHVLHRLSAPGGGQATVRRLRGRRVLVRRVHRDRFFWRNGAELLGLA